MQPAFTGRGSAAKFSGRVGSVFLAAFLVIVVYAHTAFAPCSLPDLPSCVCYATCSAVGAPWPPSYGDIVEVARGTVGLRTCCFQHGGQAYWQVQRQATIPASAEALAFEEPGIEADDDTDPEAWCTETIAYWGQRSTTPYADGYYTARHHPSSYVRGTEEMRQWYIDEEAFGGLFRGRWIDGTELDYANFEPGVNGPCPGAYQQLYKWDPTDADGDGTSWDAVTTHSQLIDSMVVHRINGLDGPIQRIDVHMVEGNVGFAGNEYARVINTRWYLDIIHFTALGEDDEVVDTSNRKIRGWGINLDADGDPDYDPGRIRTEVTYTFRAYPLPTGSENSDGAHVAAMLTYYAVTGGNVLVNSNSPSVATGGALPTETTPWVIPPAPHPVNPVYIDIDLLAQHPTPVSAITIDWVDGPPAYCEIWWSSQSGPIMQRPIVVPSGAPSVPPGTIMPFTVALDPSSAHVGFPIRYARICIPNSSLNRPYAITGFHYHFYSTDEEDAGGSAPEGDAIASGIDDGPAAAPALWLSGGAPNPFEGTTSLSFVVPEGPVELTIYDVAGRRVRTLVSGIRGAGRHDVVWDGRGDTGRSVPAGVYFARLEARHTTVTRKLVLIR